MFVVDLLLAFGKSSSHSSQNEGKACRIKFQGLKDHHVEGVEGTKRKKIFKVDNLEEDHTPKVKIKIQTVSPDHVTK